MKKEIAAAVDFLVQFIASRESVLVVDKIDDSPPDQQTRILHSQLEVFRYSLMVALWTHFQGHWHPSTPRRGEAYRCIRINEHCQTVHTDPRIVMAAKQSGLYEKLPEVMFNQELTIWIDPGEVSVRHGEHKLIFPIYPKH